MNGIDDSDLALEILPYIRVIVILFFIFFLFIFRKVWAKVFGGRYDKYESLIKDLPSKNDELKAKKSELLSSYNEKVDNFFSESNILRVELSQVALLRDTLLRDKICKDLLSGGSTTINDDK